MARARSGRGRGPGARRNAARTRCLGHVHPSAAVTEGVNEHLRPLRRRRAPLAADPATVRAVLTRGDERANVLADATLQRVRSAMGMA
jgi:hypothetical protein